MIPDKNEIIGHVSVIENGAILESVPFYDEIEAMSIFHELCKFYIDADYKMTKYVYCKKKVNMKNGFIEVWYF